MAGRVSGKIARFLCRYIIFPRNVFADDPQPSTTPAGAAAYPRGTFPARRENVDEVPAKKPVNTFGVGELMSTSVVLFIHGCFNWMICFKSLHGKWLFSQTSFLLNWLFGVPGIYPINTQYIRLLFGVPG